MKLFKKIVPKDFNVFLMGDNHEGTILSHRAGVFDLVRMIQGEYDGCANNYVIHHGDVIEGITMDDPRYNVETPHDFILQQIDAAAELFRPINKQTVCMLDGNHPRKLIRFGQITKKICELSGISYGTWSAKITWATKSGKVLFKSYHTHGRKTISSCADDPERRALNRRLILKRHLREKAADCILMCKGHVHQIIIQPPTTVLYMSDDGKEIRQNYTDMHRNHGDHAYIHPDYRWYVCSGSLRKMYADPDLEATDYAEEAEYDPVELGCAVAVVRDGLLFEIRKILL